MLRVDPVALDAIEVSRTRLNNRVLVSCAVDLRQVHWRSGEIADATVTLCNAGSDSGVVRLAASALRELTDAAGGFFLVDLELRGTAREDPPSMPRVAAVTVYPRAVPARIRAAA